MATLSYTTTKFSNATESFDLAVKNILLEHDDDLIQSMGANIRNYSNGVDPSLLPMANINTQSPVLMLEHYPNMINNTMVPFSIANLTEATKDAAEYMALLGRNFGATTSLPSWLNVLYSTTDEEHGLEIPAWLFYGMITTMAVCLVLRVGTILFLNGRYKNSLYKVIANKVVLRTKSDAPMLMRVKVEPLEIEGLRIFPDDGGDQDNLEMEEYGSTTRLMSRNDEDDKDK
ncbi:hypothetical protein BGX26_012952 [Mortierella sp. AD094]|nr:hypothetical protein BGX26_012952 [Mortierella sp. AD094]